MAELDRARYIEKDEIGPRSFFFYGPGGSGKSSLAVEHPGKGIYLDVDARLHELQLTEEQKKRIHVWTPDVPIVEHVDVLVVDPTRRSPTIGTLVSTKPVGFQRTVDVINELLKLAYAAKKGGPAFPYEWACWDSLTKSVDHLVKLILYNHKMTQMTETLFDVEGRQLKDTVDGFMHLPCDRILIGHSAHREKRDKETGAVLWEKITPHVYGSNRMRDELPTQFSEVYFFEGYNPADKKWYFYTKNTRLATARTTRKLEYKQEVDPKVIYA